MQLSGSRDPPTFTVSDPHRLFLKRESLKRFRFGLACAQSRETSQVSLTVLKGERKRNKGPEVSRASTTMRDSCLPFIAR